MVISLISARYIFTCLFAPRIHEDNGIEVFSNHRRLRKSRGILYNGQPEIFTILEYKAMTKVIGRTNDKSNYKGHYAEGKTDKKIKVFFINRKDTQNFL